MLETREIQNLLSQIELPDHVASDLCRRSDQCCLQRNIHDALWYCEEAISLAKRHGQHRCLGIAHLHRWAVYYTGHNMPEIDNATEHAIEDAEAARQAFAIEGDGLAQVISLECLGLTHELREEKIRNLAEFEARSLHLRFALQTYEEALSLLRDLESSYSFNQDQSKLDRCRTLYAEIKRRYLAAAELGTRLNRQMQSQKVARPTQTMQGAYPGASASKTGSSSPPYSVRVPAGIKMNLPVLCGPVAAGRSTWISDEVAAEYVLASRLTIDAQEYAIAIPGTGRGRELILTQDKEYFIVPVVGRSMNQAGIEEGDLAFLSRPRGQPVVATPGDIVSVAVRELGDTYATLKRYVIRDNKHLLRAESDDPQYAEAEFTPQEWANQTSRSNVQIVGILVAILKRIP